MVYDVCTVYQCPPPYDILQILYLTIAILCLIPFFKLVQNYEKLGSKDYLIFGGIFFSTSINLIINFIKPWNINLDDELLPLNLVLLVKIEYISFNLTHFFIYIHSYRLLWDNPPRFVTLGWLLFSLLLLTLIVFILPDEFFIAVWAVLSEIHRMIAGLLGIIAYRRVEPINPTYRIQSITRYWKWATGVIMFNGILQILILAFFAIGWIPNFHTIRTSSIIILGLISISLALYIAIKYPESMLVSHVQLMRASKLYRKIEEIKKAEGHKSINRKQDELTKYLLSISHLVQPQKSVS